MIKIEIRRQEKEVPSPRGPPILDCDVTPVRIYVPAADDLGFETSFGP